MKKKIGTTRVSTVVNFFDAYNRYQSEVHTRKKHAFIGKRLRYFKFNLLKNEAL